MVLCTPSDKGPRMSGVWWLKVVQFRRFAFSNHLSGKKKNNNNNNNKDSTEI